jgi:hypothetical protein
LQRLPIEKKVFWEDLGVARKIYQNKALLAPFESGKMSGDDRDIQEEETPHTIEEESHHKVVEEEKDEEKGV